MKLARLFGLALAATFLPANASQDVFHDTQYTVLPMFYIDLGRRVVNQRKGDRNHQNIIENCSSDEAFCIRSLCGQLSTPDCRPGDEFALLWPRRCVRHMEVGDTIEHAGISSRLIGYYNRVIHHTGLRGREFVFAIDGRPDTAMLVSGTKIRGFLIDTTGSNQIETLFESQSLLDADEVRKGEVSGIISVPVFPNSIGGECIS